MKKIILIILTLIVVRIAIFIVALIPIGLFAKNGKPPTPIYLSFDQNLQYRQGLNQCAPYSVMAVTNVLTGLAPDPDEIDKTMGWRWKNRMTLPPGILDSLKQLGFKAKQQLLIFYTRQQKLLYLKQKLLAGKPLILLNKTDGIQHYFTLIGYDESHFFLYDSLQILDTKLNSRRTYDDNGLLPGNRTYTYNKLLELWGAGGKGPFRWYVITVSNG